VVDDLCQLSAESDLVNVTIILLMRLLQLSDFIFIFILLYIFFLFVCIVLFYHVCTASTMYTVSGKKRGHSILRITLTNLDTVL